MIRAAAGIGRGVEGVAYGVAGATALFGGLLLALPAALRGSVRARRSDFVDALAEAGYRALPIVTVVNFLVGGILAFVGAVQLVRFGAGIYVANLVGIAVVREMAAVMTAIVMAGRTGASFAARLATMQGNEEVDALVVLGISPVEHLVLPRAAALTITLPLLYLYGCAVGLLGGLAVSALLLDVGTAAFVGQLREALNADQFVIGFVKCLAFGAFLGVTSCHVGLRAGRSAAEVGRATTSAVVIGIVGIIAIDAAFALFLNALHV
ncbi:MlaE family ABC transporter permease [Belnapia arida]|uniref:MlaE family ABC transporter permease n=1 Tax=Belnapia arida TaxID=2804533 RepID=UPI0038B2C508